MLKKLLEYNNEVLGRTISFKDGSSVTIGELHKLKVFQVTFGIDSNYNPFHIYAIPVSKNMGVFKTPNGTPVSFTLKYGETPVASEIYDEIGYHKRFNRHGGLYVTPFATYERKLHRNHLLTLMESEVSDRELVRQLLGPHSGLISRIGSNWDELSEALSGVKECAFLPGEEFDYDTANAVLVNLFVILGICVGRCDLLNDSFDAWMTKYKA